MMGFIKCILVLTIIIKTVKSDDYAENRQFETKLIRLMEDLDREKSIKIFKDVIWIEKLSINETQKSLRDEGERGDALLSRIDEFLRSREIKIRLPSDGSSADFFGRALGEKNFDIELKSVTGGDFEGRSKLKKFLLPIVMAFKLKAIIVLPIIITLIGVLGIKGIGIGILALLLSSSVALKALLTSPSSNYRPQKVNHFYHQSNKPASFSPYLDDNNREYFDWHRDIQVENQNAYQPLLLEVDPLQQQQQFVSYPEVSILS